MDNDNIGYVPEARDTIPCPPPSFEHVEMGVIDLIDDFDSEDDVRVA